jgi:hypothetical protein
MFRKRAHQQYASDDDEGNIAPHAALSALDDIRGLLAIGRPRSRDDTDRGGGSRARVWARDHDRGRDRERDREREQREIDRSRENRRDVRTVVFAGRPAERGRPRFVGPPVAPPPLRDDPEAEARHFHYRTFTGLYANVAAAAGAVAAQKEGDEEESLIESLVCCPICHERIPNASSREVRVALCAHVFHKEPRDCWERATENTVPGGRPSCPTCGKNMW